MQVTLRSDIDACDTSDGIITFWDSWLEGLRA